MKFVVVGHITRDVVPDGYTLGGTASYASIAAKRLGADVTVLTRADPDDSDHPALRDINVIVLPSEHTTTFENTYHNGVRQQQLRAVAAPILAEDVPAELVDREREIYKAQALESGKPENIVEKIVTGKIDKYVSEICLMEQKFVKNPDLSIQDLLNELIAKMGENISVKRFARFQLGA